MYLLLLAFREKLQKWRFSEPNWTAIFPPRSSLVLPFPNLSLIVKEAVVIPRYAFCPRLRNYIHRYICKRLSGRDSMMFYEIVSKYKVLVLRISNLGSARLRNDILKM